MGIFKKILKVGQKVAKTIDPIGGGKFADPLGAATGAYDKQGAAAATAPPDPNAGMADPNAGYYGDQGDSEYGSLLQPFDVEQFYNYEDPGYAFRQQQGMQAVQNSAAAGSGALSGAALKDLLMFNQEAASQEYNNAFNRYQTQQGNIFSRLSSILQLGQNAAAGVGAQGTSLAGNAGQAYTNAGSAAGAGIVGAGNAIGQGATNYWLYNNPQLWQRPAVAGGV
jgi:hypothetical protein